MENFWAIISSGFVCSLIAIFHVSFREKYNDIAKIKSIAPEIKEDIRRYRVLRRAFDSDGTDEVIQAAGEVFVSLEQSNKLLTLSEEIKLSLCRQLSSGDFAALSEYFIKVGQLQFSIIIRKYNSRDFDAAVKSFIELNGNSEIMSLVFEHIDDAERIIDRYLDNCFWYLWFQDVSAAIKALTAAITKRIKASRNK